MEMVKTKTAFPKYSAYKDSGEYWMGDIPEHWDIKKLKHVFLEKKKVTNSSLNCGSISFGKVVYKDDEKVPESTKASYQEVLAGEYLVNPLNLNYDLISLRIGLSDINVVVSSGYIVLKNAIEINKSYFNYLLHRYDVAYMKLLGSGVRQTISFNHIANSLLAYPPKEEQTAIANFLDEKTAKIDRVIAQKEKMIELLKERKQIIIQNAVTKGLDPNVNFKDSGVEWIEEIPEHWEVKKMFHVAKIDTGATPDRSKETYWGGKIPWVKTGEVNYRTIFETEEHITEAGLKNSATRLAPVGALLMAMYGQGVTRGRVSLLGIKATYNQACCAMVFRDEVFNEFAFYYFVMAYSFIRDAGNETSQMNISSGYISSLKILCPPIKEQNKIVQFINEQELKYDQAISLQQTQIEKLKEYKATLIDSAVTGKIKVS
ncbi:MAG: type I restriction endonuclease subunit S [Cyclobacteriaceae bacterium]|nr:MAG: type I restriction endonuclease subunit S [Cyclobacteriaceae bacterium]